MDERHDDTPSFDDGNGRSDAQTPTSDSFADVYGMSQGETGPLPITDSERSNPTSPPSILGDAGATNSDVVSYSYGENTEQATLDPDLFTTTAPRSAVRYQDSFTTESTYPRYQPGGQAQGDSQPSYDTQAGLSIPLRLERRAAPPTRNLTPARTSPLRRAFLPAIILLCFLLGYGGIYGTSTISDALAATRDAKAQAAAIQGILSGGHLTEVATLIALQTRLHALDADLNQIRSDEPGQPLFNNIFGGTAPAHALNMAQDLTWAGLYAVDAGLVIAPHIKSIISGITGSATGAGANKPSAGTSSSGPLTLAEINQASVDINAAGPLVTLALTERAHVRDSDLQSLGLGSFVHTLRTLDSFAPKLPTYLNYGKQILAALPDLLGVTKPANYLLLDLDSDELRPSGGFQGVYGILTFKRGTLSSGVHLQNIYTIDCQGGFPPNCPVRPLPSSYNWFSYHEGLRNANLDPNYPATARLDEHMLAVDHGPSVAGVISLTPVIIQQALTLTGPLSVPGYPQKMTAQNFSELIHYYHSITGSANTSKTKAFDAAAGSALLRAFSKLSQANQSKLSQELLADLRSGDLQVYFNDPHIESTLAALTMDGALRTPAGDTFEVVNTNHGANYANADVTATESDHVVINSQGAATHTLTITYHFPLKRHLYPSYLVSVYRDFIQVLAPPHAHLQSIRGCAPVKITEPGWADWGCDMTLWRGGSATVVFQWVTPNATTKIASGGVQYNLLVQRQAGTHDALSVTITLPAGARLTQPLMKGLTAFSGNQARYSATLSDDQALSLAWAG